MERTSCLGEAGVEVTGSVNDQDRFEVVAIAASAGGIGALRKAFFGIPSHFEAPVLLALHRSKSQLSCFLQVLQYSSQLTVCEASEGTVMTAGTIYVAPPGRHLEVGPDRRLSVARSGRVSFVHPSADLLFSSVAKAYGPKAIGLVLSGAGDDGAQGVVALRKAGGYVIAQDPQTAEHASMPQAALNTSSVDIVLDARQIAFALTTLTGTSEVPMRPRAVSGRPRVRTARSQTAL